MFYKRQLYWTQSFLNEFRVLFWKLYMLHIFYHISHYFILFSYQCHFHMCITSSITYQIYRRVGVASHAENWGSIPGRHKPVFKTCLKVARRISKPHDFLNKGFLGAYYVTVWTAASFFGTNQFQTFTFDQYKFTSLYATCRFAIKKNSSERISALELLITLRMVLVMPGTHVFIA